MKVVRYRAGDCRYLAVDAERYVPDRAAFAARHCDPEDGVTPPQDGDAPHEDEPGDGRVHVDQGVSGPREPGVAADGGPDGSSPPAGADGVLFLALEPEFRPPRVVMTVVHPDGERPACCPEGVRCAARWVAARTDADRVMVDTQAGTREARVHDDGSASVEVESGGRHADEGAMERGTVVREFAAEVEEPS